MRPFCDTQDNAYCFGVVVSREFHSVSLLVWTWVIGVIWGDGG